MHNSVSVRDVFWDKLWPGQIPAAPVTAVTVPDNRFSVEGHDLDNAVLHVPDLGESAHGGRDAWRKAVDAVKLLQPRAAGSRSAAKSISTGTKCSATVARTASARSAFRICPVSKTALTNTPYRWRNSL